MVGEGLPSEVPLGAITPRQQFEDMIEGEILTSPGQFAVLFVDIDGLRTVNNNQGHAAGDAFIVKALGVLQAYSSFTEGRASHIHGDEYLVYLRGITTNEQVEASIADIQTALIDEDVSATIGGRVHQPGESSSALLFDADAIMQIKKLQRALDSHSLGAEREARLIEHIKAIRDSGFESLYEADKFARAMGWRDRRLPRLLPEELI